ncbi:hypothetical protein ESCO_002276 [Escovopsis weberi]|uniref:Tetratricopeptide-like helical n=1 Tax=Escovopsis weberi TaxID=150374 RepID=A0A0M8MY79_ESCWE|nr:hypothetical protein ESCO_002276 [Escovopsis weberi]
MASENHAASEAAIEAGRQHYAARRYKPALEQFTRAMRGCPCSRGMKRERCSCKDFEKVAAEDGSLFKEAMYNCRCNVGRTFNKCDKAAHIQALDYRAATFEAVKELDRARRDAEWMLELAPRLPDGYLRLGKIARLQKKNDFAWSIYNAGIEVGLSNGHEKSPKMEQLYKARQPLQLRYLKRDPMQMPFDIVQLIFSYLDLVTLVPLFGKFMTNTAENLQSLRLDGFPMLWFSGNSIPMMPRLKYLICEGQADGMAATITLPLVGENPHKSDQHIHANNLDQPTLLERTPKLEQLVLENALINNNHYLSQGDRPLPMLRYLRITERRHLRPLSLDNLSSSLILNCYSAMTGLNGGNDFQALDISLAGDYSWSDPFFSDIISDKRGERQVQYTNIESFRLKSLAVEPRTARSLFEAPLLAGKLHTFDIVFPLDGLNERVGESSTEHLDGYSWLRGAESVRSLGLFSFNFSSLYSMSDEMPLLSFLKSFPNLEVLELESDRYEEAGMCMLLKDVMTTMERLKTLHQYRVKGVMLDQLLATSEDCGVKLVWGERPRQWPMQFDCP